MAHYSELANTSDGHVREAAVVERPLDYSLAELYKELAKRRGYDVAMCWRSEKALDCLGQWEAGRDSVGLSNEL